MRAPPRWTRALAIATGLALAGCSSGPLGADQQTLLRLAEELEQEVIRMRPHLAAMRQQPPAQWQRSAAEHAHVVRQMLNRMDEIMGEMQRVDEGMMGGMGMRMQDAPMSEFMGMNAEEHRDMLRLMEELWQDAEKLRTASLSGTPEWMPLHLDRLDAMLQMMEHSAEHLRSMHSMHHGS